MTALRLLLGYDGRAFSGYQAQPGRRTVQSALEATLAPLAGGAVRTTVAGRTDAGVHALGQVVSVADWAGADADAVLRALQSTLPEDVTCFDVQPAADGFDARHSARARTYTYLVWNHPARQPFLRGAALWVRDPIDIDRLAAAMNVTLGEHDFSSFARVRPEQTPMREVEEVHVSERGGLVRIEIRATAFLHQMVRSLVGSALEVATGRRPVEWMAEALEARDRAAAGPVARPHGLTLLRVDYADAPWPRRLDHGWPWERSDVREAAVAGETR